jgi:hypothetical protein
MKRKYNKIVDESLGQEVIWYVENGFKISFVADPLNTEYQAYLASQPASTVQVDE